MSRWHRADTLIPRSDPTPSATKTGTDIPSRSGCREASYGLTWPRPGRRFGSYRWARPPRVGRLQPRTALVATPRRLSWAGLSGPFRAAFTASTCHAGTEQRHRADTLIPRSDPTPSATKTGTDIPSRSGCREASYGLTWPRPGRRFGSYRWARPPRVGRLQPRTALVATPRRLSWAGLSGPFRAAFTASTCHAGTEQRHRADTSDPTPSATKTGTDIPSRSGCREASYGLTWPRPGRRFGSYRWARPPRVGRLQPRTALVATPRRLSWAGLSGPFRAAFTASTCHAGTEQRHRADTLIPRRRTD